MPITHTLVADGNYLMVTIAGAVTLAMVERLIADMVPIIRDAGLRTVLVDARAQERPIGIVNNHRVGLLLAASGLRRVAIAVIIGDPLTVPHHTETVARNRGQNIRYFNDEGQARAWLGLPTDDPRP